jgi:hypothetical protein
VDASVSSTEKNPSGIVVTGDGGHHYIISGYTMSSALNRQKPVTIGFETESVKRNLDCGCQHQERAHSLHEVLGSGRLRRHDLLSDAAILNHIWGAGVSVVPEKQPLIERLPHPLDVRKDALLRISETAWLSLQQARQGSGQMSHIELSCLPVIVSTALPWCQYLVQAEPEIILLQSLLDEPGRKEQLHFLLIYGRHQ